MFGNPLKPSLEKRQWTEGSFMDEFETRQGANATNVARRILQWALDRRLRVGYGTGKRDGSMIVPLHPTAESASAIRVFTNGRVEIPFGKLKEKRPFDDISKLTELSYRLNSIPGVDIPRMAVAGGQTLTSRTLWRIFHWRSSLECCNGSLRNSMDGKRTCSTELQRATSCRRVSSIVEKLSKKMLFKSQR